MLQQWFTRLPPVLTFELSRFQFNQNLGRPEKIHNKLHFPNLIYMDRYMMANKQITRQKREELKRLKEQLTILQDKLDKFINYGSGAKRFPLQDVLQYALEFAETMPRGGASRPVVSPSSSTTPMASPTACDDIEMDSPKSTTSMQTDSPTNTPKKSPTTTEPAHTLTPTATTDVSMTTGSPPLGVPSKDDQSGPPALPAPRGVAPEELQVLQSCLTRWRTEVESDVKELQEGIGSLELTMGAMYSDDSLKKHAYRLHAVLVHEGQAASGHYWAYTYCPAYGTWLKFNDIMVTEASWEELEKESVGGYHNASAYCLMYVQANNDLLFKVGSTVDGETGQKNAVVEGRDILPSDLKNLVIEDNKRFAQEIVDWDMEQVRRASMAQAGTGDATPSTSTSTQTPTTIRPAPTLMVQHANLVAKATDDALRRVLASDTFKNKGSADAFQEVLQHEMKRLEGLAKAQELRAPQQDPRLEHLVVYMKVNGVTDSTFMQRAIIEQFALHSRHENNHSIQQILNEARKEDRKNQAALGADRLKLYKQWHDHYHELRRTTLVFLAGVEQFHNEQYASALPYLVCSCEMSDALTASGHKLRGLDHRLLSYYRRQCVLHVNDVAATQFDTEESLTETLDLMERLILPSIGLLSNTRYHDDKNAVDDIREKWCSFLGQTVSGEKIEKLQDLLAKLFDIPSEVKVMYPSTVKRVIDTPELATRYATIIKTSTEGGYIEAAAASK